MPTYTATRAGTWPPGLHWTEGETRTLGTTMAELAVGLDVPAWLVEEVAPAPAADEPVGPEFAVDAEPEEGP